MYTFVFPLEIDGRRRSTGFPPPLMLLLLLLMMMVMMVRLLMPLKDVLVDQEPSVLMNLGEQLALMTMLLVHRAVVVLTNERVDDRDADVSRARVTGHHARFDILHSKRQIR